MTSVEELSGFARSCLRVSESTPMGLQQLPVRGSDRSFFRITWDDSSSILIQYNKGREENNYYAEIANFLTSIGVSVPAVYGHDPEKRLLLLEDLGSCDLFSFKKTGPEQLYTLYQNTLKEIYVLHAFPITKLPSAVPLMDGFDETLYAWEHDYFKVHFVQEMCGIVLNESRSEMLQKEFSLLTEQLLDTKACLIHRDLQSQNVMMRSGKPYFIDFQGMRPGNRLYDIGSLLNDPYMMLPEDDVLLLLRSYYELSDSNIVWPRFVDLFWEASVQRLMQALGAYAFLSKNKGLHSFLEHVPAGLAKLRAALSHAPRLQTLNGLVLECSAGPMTHNL